MKYLVLALWICAASAASLGAYKPYNPPQQVAKAVAEVVQAPVVVAEAPVVAARTVAPVVASRTVAPVVASRTVAPVVASRTVAPVVASRTIAPVVASRTVVPVAASRTVVPVAKNVYSDEAHASVLRLDSEVSADGYNYVYETDNGISAQSSGSLKKVDNTDVLAIEGSYQYVSPDGTPVRFVYVADENGFHPESDVLPVPPAIPEAILRSLEYIRTHPPKPEKP